jgi:hypothetical protein
MRYVGTEESRANDRAGTPTSLFWFCGVLGWNLCPFAERLDGLWRWGTSTSLLSSPVSEGIVSASRSSNRSGGKWISFVIVFERGLARNDTVSWSSSQYAPACLPSVNVK